MQISSHKLPTAIALVIGQFTCVHNELTTHDPLFGVAIICALSVKEDLLLRYFPVSFHFRGTESQTRDFLNDSHLLFKMKREWCQCFSQSVAVITPSSEISDGSQSWFKIFCHQGHTLSGEHQFYQELRRRKSQKKICIFVTGNSKSRALCQEGRHTSLGVSSFELRQRICNTHVSDITRNVQILRSQIPAKSGVSNKNIQKALAYDRRFADL